MRFSAEELAAAVRADLLLAAAVRDVPAAVHTALITLHDWKLITLQQGLAIFRQAMTLALPAAGRGRSFTAADYAPLARHYVGRIFQVHVMEEYARRGIDSADAASRLAADYFCLADDDFAARHFEGREEDFARPLSPRLFARIVTDLANPAQEGIVTAPPDGNMLVLAGPGSGKTRVIVHRAAWLVRGLRLPAGSILILCFSRAAAQSVRRRLRALVGEDAGRVDVFTYHGLAMRLVGASFAEAGERLAGAELEARLAQVVRDASALLSGAVAMPGLDPDEVRERLLARYRTILIDEYQDIDGDQYALVSAIAGRGLADAEARIALVAVGDDDQAVYGFRGASVAFIRRFERDYAARRHYLTENYRSTEAIIAASNALIAGNVERMKTAHPIRRDRARSEDAEGGRWERLDPLVRGRVQRLQATCARHQAAAALAEAERLRAAGGGVPWHHVAVLSPRRRELTRLRVLCEARGVPVTPLGEARGRPFPWSRLREVQALLEALSGERLTAAALKDRMDAAKARIGPSPWWALADDLLAEVVDGAPASGLPRAQAREIVFDGLAQMRRERPPAHGLMLATLHGAKGLEFAHVIILDGGWGEGASEEARRLFYVGMTRARETLTLLHRDDGHHPHLARLGAHLLARRPPVPMPTEDLDVAIDVLGLDALHIGYAGSRGADERIHADLRALGPGAPLELAFRDGERGRLLTRQGRTVARLSEAGSERWAPRAGRIRKVSVAAMVRRRAEDSTDPAYRDRLRCETWEVPIPEVWWSPVG